MNIVNRSKYLKKILYIRIFDCYCFFFVYCGRYLLFSLIAKIYYLFTHELSSIYVLIRAKYFHVPSLYSETLSIRLNVVYVKVKIWRRYTKQVFSKFGFFRWK